MESCARAALFDVFWDSSILWDGTLFVFSSFERKEEQRYRIVAQSFGCLSDPKVLVWQRLRLVKGFEVLSTKI